MRAGPLTAALALGVATGWIAVRAETKAHKAPAAYAQAVRGVVDSRLGEVAACVDPARLPPDLKEVKVAAQVTILSDGAVLSATRTAGGKGAASTSEAIARCMLDKVRAWRFPPPPDRQTVVVDFPIALRLEPAAAK